MILREAKKEYLERVKMETLKKTLIEQCKDAAKLNLEICDDFKYVDGGTERYKEWWDCHAPKAVFAMTEGRDNLINNFGYNKMNKIIIK